VLAIAEMTKAQLQERRAQLIASLETTNHPARREEVQADLSNVNARLKQINIVEAKRAKTQADERKAAGLAEQRDNLRRSAAKHPARDIELADLPPMPSAPPSQQRPLSRGEFMLKHAKQLKKAIESIKPDHRLPHTVAFIAHLDAFIAGQKAHLANPATAETNTEAGWKQTWQPRKEAS